MSTEKDALDYFGKFLMESYRDKALNILETTLNNRWESGSFKEFQAFLQTLSEQQRKNLFSGFQLLIDATLHDLLFSLEEENNFTNRIKVLVDGQDIVKLSDGIYGELFGNNSWIEKFSKYNNRN